MKLNTILLPLVISILISACQDKLKDELQFNVEVEVAQGVQVTDTVITTSVNVPLNFIFDGSPDFISYTYEKFIPTWSTLEFNSQAAWGTHIANTLQVFLSDSMPVLELNKFKNDSVTILSHAWTEITDLCNLPSTTNNKTFNTINLEEYKGKKVVIAFRYKTSFVDDWQPTWLVSDLQIRNKLISDSSSVSDFLAASLGFMPFDMNKGDSTAYLSSALSGSWFLDNPASMEMKRTSRGNILNEDWLISKPIEISDGLIEISPNNGIKNISNRLENFEYSFEKEGQYKLTFMAKNANYLFEETAIKTFTVIVNPE